MTFAVAKEDFEGRAGFAGRRLFCGGRVDFQAAAHESKKLGHEGEADARAVLRASRAAYAVEALDVAESDAEQRGRKEEALLTSAMREISDSEPRREISRSSESSSGAEKPEGKRTRNADTRVSDGDLNLVRVRNDRDVDGAS